MTLILVCAAVVVIGIGGMFIYKNNKIGLDPILDRIKSWFKRK